MGGSCSIVPHGTEFRGGKAQREALRMTYEELTVMKRRTRPDWAPGQETAADDCRCSPGNAAECDAVIEGQIEPPTSANQKNSFTGIRPHKPKNQGVRASAVSQLMSEFKVPECHLMAASWHSGNSKLRRPAARRGETPIEPSGHSLRSWSYFLDRPLWLRILERCRSNGNPPSVPGTSGDFRRRQNPCLPVDRKGMKRVPAAPEPSHADYSQHCDY